MTSEIIAVSILWIVLLYVCAGAIFSIAFLLNGIQKVDESTRGSGVGFKFIIIPGVVLLWPVLLKKWSKGTQKKTDQGL